MRGADDQEVLLLLISCVQWCDVMVKVEVFQKLSPKWLKSLSIPVVVAAKSNFKA